MFTTDAVRLFNAACRLLGDTEIAATFEAGTPSAPNGGTAANAVDQNDATVVTTTTSLGVASRPFVIASVALTSGTVYAPAFVAYVDIIRLSMSVSSSDEFYVQISLDGNAWKTISARIFADTTNTNRRRINIMREAKYVRLMWDGFTSPFASTAYVSLAGFEVYLLAGTDNKTRNAKALYASVREDVLCKHPWRCTLRKHLLVANVVAPLGRYTYTYLLPDILIGGGPRAVYADEDSLTPYKNWAVQGLRLLTDLSGTIVIDYQVREEEGNWPPYLVQLVKYALAAELAEPLTDQTSKAGHWHEKAYGPPASDGKGGQFRTARNLDSQGNPSPGIEDFSLIEVRM